MSEIKRVNGHLVVDGLRQYNASALRDFVEGTLRYKGFKFSRAEKTDKHGKRVAIYIPQGTNERDRWPTIHVFNRPQRLEEWAEGLDMKELTRLLPDSLRCERIAFLKGRNAKGVPEHYPAADVWSMALMLREQLTWDRNFTDGYSHFLFNNAQRLISFPDSYGEFHSQMDSAA